MENTVTGHLTPFGRRLDVKKRQRCKLQQKLYKRERERRTVPQNKEIKQQQQPKTLKKDLKWRERERERERERGREREMGYPKSGENEFGHVQIEYPRD